MDLPPPTEQVYHVDEHYYQKTQEDLANPDLLPVSYTVRTNNTPLSPPSGWYGNAHLWFAEKMFDSKGEGSKQNALRARESINLEGNIRYERRTLDIDGAKGDVLFMTNPSSISNDRWTVISFGIRALYENRVAQEADKGLGPLQQMMEMCNTNLVVYNYPGMGASDDTPLFRESTVRAHNGVLEFLYDEKHPKQVVDYGHSFGGFVISEGCASRPSAKSVSRITVFDRTDIQASNILWNDGYAEWFLDKTLNWNMGIDLSKEDNPIIAMMNVETDRAVRLRPGDTFTYTDKAVTQGTSVANIMLNTVENPFVIGIPGQHNDTCPDFSVLGECIEEIFSSS